MRNLLAKVAVMSVTLILLCVIVMAQNENETKSTTNNTYGVVVAPNPVTLGPGEVKGVIITPDVGYYHPRIIYDNKTYEIGQTIYGRIFTIRKPTNSNSPYTFMVEASDDVTEDYELIGISVEMIPYDLRSINTSQNQPLTVPIIVSSPTK